MQLHLLKSSWKSAEHRGGESERVQTLTLQAWCMEGKASNCGGFTIQVRKFNFTASLLATAIWRQVQLAIEYTQYPHL